MMLFIPTQKVDPTLPAWIKLSILIGYAAAITFALGIGVAGLFGYDPIGWLLGIDSISGFSAFSHIPASLDHRMT